MVPLALQQPPVHSYEMQILHTADRRVRECYNSAAFIVWNHLLLVYHCSPAPLHKTEMFSSAAPQEHSEWRGNGEGSESCQEKCDVKLQFTESEQHRTDHCCLYRSACTGLVVRLGITWHVLNPFMKQIRARLYYLQFFCFFSLFLNATEKLKVLMVGWPCPYTARLLLVSYHYVPKKGSWWKALHAWVHLWPIIWQS